MDKQLILHPSTSHQVQLFLSSGNLNSIGINGQAGSGKSYLAAHLAENILQIKNTQLSPYVKIIDCAENIGIDGIRQLKVFLRLRVPSKNRFSRCVIIEHLDLLGTPAQNALLKTLEEPPAGTVIIATVSSKNNILPTIVSRLQWVNLLPLSENQLQDQFFAQYDKSDLQKAFLLSRGNAAALITMASDPESYSDLRSAIAEAKALLRCTRFEKLAKIDSIIKNEQYTLEQLLDAMIKILRSVIANSPQSSSKETVNKLGSVVKAREELRHNPSHKLLLSVLFNKL